MPTSSAMMTRMFGCLPAGGGRRLLGLRRVWTARRRKSADAASSVLLLSKTSRRFRPSLIFRCFRFRIFSI